MSDTPQNADQLSKDEIMDEAELKGEARSPVSGMGTAMGAGANLLETAQSLLARKARRGVNIELPAYLSVQATW